ISRMSWSQDPNVYRVVFLVGDAPPHMDYQNDVKYPVTVAAAAAKGIVVNTIQCGSASDTAAHWRQIAALGHGRYFTVEQAGSAVAIETPFDHDIAKLAADLDGTRMYYGSLEEKAVAASKVEATDKLRAEASVAAQARRGAFNASASGMSNLLGGRELVDDVASGRVDLAGVAPAALPPAIARLEPKEQRQLLAATAEKRKALQSEIAKLAKERDAYIKGKVEAQGGAKDSLDQQIYDAVREQAAPIGLKYEDGPKF